MSEVKLSERPEVKAYCDENGYMVRELAVLRFDGPDDGRPWFYQDHEVLGSIEAICDGPQPIDSGVVLRCASDYFGEGAEVMW